MKETTKKTKMKDDKVIKSIRFVQGNWFDESNKLASEEQVNALQFLLTSLSNIEPDINL